MTDIKFEKLKDWVKYKKNMFKRIGEKHVNDGDIGNAGKSFLEASLWREVEIQIEDFELEKDILEE